MSRLSRSAISEVHHRNNAGFAWLRVQKHLVKLRIDLPNSLFETHGLRRVELYDVLIMENCFTPETRHAVELSVFCSQLPCLSLAKHDDPRPREAGGLGGRNGYMESGSEPIFTPEP